MWQRLLERMLDHLIRVGTLIVEMPDGAVRRYGDGAGEPVRARIHDAATVRELVLRPELRVGEAYMEERLTIEGDDLRGFLSVVIGNQAGMRTSWWQKSMMGGLAGLRQLQMYNPVGRARRNAAHHYDLSGELYDLFLDADKQYSCAYFADPEATLEAAQEAKKAHIAAKLRLSPGMRVLDIGCGWGGMALTLARDYGARVLGVTLSEEQHRAAQRRAERAGLSDRVEFRLADYREITERFDRIVSVGMFEHVGLPHYRAFFGHVRDTLTEDGVALIHCIGRSTPPGTTNPWVLKYIFPGAYAPAMSEVMTAVEKTGLWTTDVEVWRLHYAETLRHWQQRFMANVDRAREIYDDRFCRMWRFYLIASELSFRLNNQIVFQFQLTRRQDAVPLTRDYLYRPQAELGRIGAPAAVK